MARSSAARSAPRRRPPATRRRNLPRRLSGPTAGGGAVALPGRVMRAPFTRAARARTGGVLDALLQGRAWIALVAVLLVGIVFFNVDLLELNRDIARTGEKAAALKRQNAGLRLQLARLASSERIQRVAARRGLELPAPGDVRYLRLRPWLDARNAAARMVEPGSEQTTPVPSSTPPAQRPAAPTTAPGAPAATPPGTQTTTTTPQATATPPSSPAGGTTPAPTSPAGGTGG